MTTYTKSEVIGLMFSGGVANSTPSLALGGDISARRVVGMYPLISVAVGGLIIEDATPECGEGSAAIVCSAGAAIFTPPGGPAGAAISVAEGAREFLTGASAAKGVWVSRVAGLSFEGTASFRLVDQMNGVMSMADVQDADRVAGAVHYRALFLQRLGVAGKSWVWITTDGQSAFALASEDPESDGSIQAIADEDTAPTAVSWVDAVSEATALEIPPLGVDGSVGVWIRRTFPAAGVVALDEQVNFHLKVEEGG